MDIDDIRIKILEDGTIKVETDQIGQANHLNADKFLREMSRMAGGQAVVTKKKSKVGHVHSHGEASHSH